MAATRSRIAINQDTYTQINTDPSTFLVQNLSQTPVGIIITDGDAPLDTELPTYYFGFCDGCSSNTLEGIIWAKTRAGENGIMGLTEG